jgi:hypothetical protein
MRILLCCLLPVIAVTAAASCSPARQSRPDLPPPVYEPARSLELAPPAPPAPPGSSAPEPDPEP